MKNAILFATAASLCMGTMASAQTAAPIRIGTPSNAVLASVPSETAQLKAKIDALTALVNQQQQQIAGLQNAMKAASTKGFENAGEISKLQGEQAKLRTEFAGHTHYSLREFDTPDGKHHLDAVVTTPPTKYCTRKPGVVYGLPNNKYDCSVPAQ